ncbi:hypothetical protein Tco_1523697 [Tanacetum coccineum]
MSFSKRPDSDAVCYTKPLDSLKHWNDHFFWVDSFACPTLFSWHTDKNVSRDPFSKSTEFNANHYPILVAHPAPFWKFPEPFLCLVGMSRYYTLDEDTYPSFFHDDGTVADPTKVKVGERERADGEAKLLDSTVGRVVPLLPVAPAHADSELEASVDMLFNEGGSADQRDSASGGGQEAETELVTGVRIFADENVVAEKPKRPRKKRQAVTDASGSSHPPKKLKGDHGTSSGAATGGKSPSVLKELLASSMLNVEAGVEAVATLILLVHLKSLSAVVPLVMTEAVITSHAVNAPSVPVPETGTKIPSPVHASMFHDSDSTETVNADAAGPSYSAKQDLSMGSRELNAETFRQIHEMDYHHLFTEFNVGTARQACLNEFIMRTEYCLSERKRSESECEKQVDLLKAKDDEIENLKAQLPLKETEAAEAARLRAQVSAAEAMEKMHAAQIDALKQRNVALESEKDSLDGKVVELQSSVSAKDLELKDLNVAVSSLRSQKDGLVDQVHMLETTCSGLRDQVSGYKRLKEQIEEVQDAQMNIVNDKVVKLDADLLEMALHLEEKFYPHILTIIFGQRWLLTHDLKLAIVKCLNSQEYLSALGAVISRAIEKGMQDGLSAVAEADYNSALQRLREVHFPLLAKLKSHKDASTADVMDLLRLEGPLANAPGMSDLQPDVKQLTLPIHLPKDQVVLGETSLSFALSITHSQVERIRDNVTAHQSALIDVWVPLVDPLSAKSLIGKASTFDSVPAAVVTTTALSTTFASVSSVPPITIEDYEIVGTNGPEDA